jgi:hypothetical protein
MQMLGVPAMVITGFAHIPKLPSEIINPEIILLLVKSLINYF